MNLRATVTALIVATSTMAAPDKASAQEHDAEARLNEQLAAAHTSAQRWHWTWAGLFAANVVAQGITTAAVAETPRQRGAQALGGLPPAVGFTLLFATPLAALSLEDDLAAVPAGDTTAARIAAKRELLHRYAASEAEKRNWFAHAGPIALNASVAAALLWGFDEPLQAGLQLGVGTLVSELQVWTSPQAATEAVEGIRPEPAGAVELAPILTPGFVGVHGRF